MDDAQLAEVAALLQRGGVVVLPTDTVYGLVAMASDRAATGRIFDLKGRGHDVPVAVLCADAEQALGLVDPDAGRSAMAVAQRWWPGPLTLVLPRRSGTGLHLGRPEETIGVRVPDHDLVRALAARVGPLAATSANRHGSPTPVTADEVAQELGTGVDLVIDGGPLADAASTVMDATTWPWRVLRPGALDVEHIVATAAAAADPADG